MVVGLTWVAANSAFWLARQDHRKEMDRTAYEAYHQAEKCTMHRWVLTLLGSFMSNHTPSISNPVSGLKNR